MDYAYSKTKFQNLTFEQAIKLAGFPAPENKSMFKKLYNIWRDYKAMRWYKKRFNK